MQKKRTTGIVNLCTGAVLSVSFFLFVLATALRLLGTSPGVMLPLMKHTAPPERTGLTADMYAPVVDMITGYIRGEEEAFQYVLEGQDGARYLLFHDYEQAHMQDVKDLFSLARSVQLVSGCILILCVALAIWHRRAREIYRGILFGEGILVCVLLGLGIWGMVNFNGLFITFHLLLFSNGLWFLNPATDLLIRLMPTEFFVLCGAVVFSVCLTGMLILLCLSLCGMKWSKMRR
ncbi:MAG: TIGR01906 family membrane protein [Clostridia bacterium]|nr:TIGR01906 family membrane protein [Clostridia bacterium]